MYIIDILVMLCYVKSILFKAGKQESINQNQKHWDLPKVITSDKTQL